MKQRRHWVVTHCEVHLRPHRQYAVDEIPDHVAGSLAVAERFIRDPRRWVEPGTWWGIYQIDPAQGALKWMYYTRRGRRLPSQPIRAGVEWARRLTRRRIVEIVSRIRNAEDEGLSKETLRGLRATVRYMRACLR